MFLFVPCFESKKIYFYIQLLTNLIYCTENRPPTVIYVTAVTRYFSVHYIIGFNNLIVLYIIIVVVPIIVTVDTMALGVLYSSLCGISSSL
jgi:hypothetical protein